MKIQFVFIIFLCHITFLQAQEFQLNETESTLEWTGKAAFSAYSLSGTIEAQEGSIKIEDQKIIYTQLTINARSINASNKQLKKHLRSEDFFDVKKYPEAMFELSEFILLNQDQLLAKGKMTIKGITKAIVIPLTIEQTNGQVSASGTATINRTDYGIRYNSPTFFTALKDQAIADEFEVTFDLIFDRSSS